MGEPGCVLVASLLLTRRIPDKTHYRQQRPDPLLRSDKMSLLSTSSSQKLWTDASSLHTAFERLD